MKVYFVPGIPSFIPAEWRADGTYSEKTWPASAVLLEESVSDKFLKVSPPAGKRLGSHNGLPVWVDIPPPPALTRDEVESLRLRSYADPLAGSDRLFSESTRMQIMNESGFEEVLGRAIARFEEIQAQYPWPAK